MTLSIRRRLVLTLVPAVVVVWAVAIIATYLDTRRRITEIFDAELVQSAQVILAVTEHELYEEMSYHGYQPSTAKFMTPSGHGVTHNVAFQVWVKEHLVIYSESAPKWPLATQLEAFEDRLVNGQMWRIFSMINREKGIAVHVGEAAQRRDELSDATASRLVTYVAVSLPIIVVIIGWGVGNAIAQLRRIAAEVGYRKMDNLEAIDLQGIPGEIRPLLNAINSLFERLKSAIDNIRHFTADAAHELRTPLSALKAHAQLAQRAEDGQMRDVALEKVVVGVDRMSYLLDQLLTLARLDSKRYTPSFRPFPLFEVCRQVLAEQAVNAVNKQIDIGLDGDTRACIHGDPGMAEILIANLVSNAIKYTPVGGTVAVTCIGRGDTVRLEVSDSGPGIPSAERQKVVQRFYRRAGHDAPGSGLGLSIVVRITQIFHAEFSLEDSPWGGVMAVVVFPRFASGEEHDLK